MQAEPPGMSERRKPRLSLATQIFIALGTGILAGIFFGDTVKFLSIVGDSFVSLLQMTVLPYIMVSLTAALGRLTYSQAVMVFKKCGVILLLLWGATLLCVLLMPLAFPDWETASFFSTSLIEKKSGFDFIKLFIPANIFNSLASNTVPAVVLFSCGVGVALIGVEKKHLLLDNLSVAADALTRLTSLIVRLAPIGVFAIAAGAASTLHVSELGRVGVYFVSYLSFWLLLAFWILPVMVSSVTPLTYRDVTWYSRDALITAFATGNLLVVLPMLAGKTKELLKRSSEDADPDTSAVDVIVPASYNFPSVGKLMSLAFLLYAGWSSGTPVPLAQYPAFTVSGVFTFFGSTAVAVPFLLDFLRIPADMFQLFLISDVFLSRFGAYLAAAHTLAIALIGSFAIQGSLRVQWKKLFRFAVLTVVFLAAGILMARMFCTYALTYEYTKDRFFVTMSLQGEVVPAVVHDVPPEPRQLTNRHESRLDLIVEEGSLRVGYLRDTLPFLYRNTAGDLVGFDVEMAHGLAKDLGVSLEFVPVERESLADPLNDGVYDVLISSVAITPERSLQILFARSHLEATLAFIVKDHLREKFDSREAVKSLKAPRIGVLNVPYYVSGLKKYLPQAEIVLLDSPRDFFKNPEEDLDAMFYSAEGGSAWTLLYPSYSVALPYPDIIAVPAAYAVPTGDQTMVAFLNDWLELKKQSGSIKRTYNYWIEGQGGSEQTYRWSVIRDVLHWVD